MRINDEVVRFDIHQTWLKWKFDTQTEHAFRFNDLWWMFRDRCPNINPFLNEGG